MADSRREVLKEGFLKKRSRNVIPALRKWQPRYFKLYTNELVYGLSPTGTAVRRRVALGLDSLVQMMNDEGYALCFVVKASVYEDNFYLQAESEKEKEEWSTTIFDAARRLPKAASPPPVSNPRGFTPEVSRGLARPQLSKRVLLHLTVQGARNLRSADFDGKSDPFCVVNLVGKNGEFIRREEIKTNYVKDSLNSEWDAKFTIGKAVDLQSVDAIHFDVCDHYYFSKNSSLGCVRIPLPTVDSSGQSEPVDRWYRLEPPQKTSTLPRQAVLKKAERTEDCGELRLIMGMAGPNLVS